MHQLIGIWLYSSLIYQGHPVARPDENLIMQFIFHHHAENEIFYYRQNETGYCRRTAKYIVSGDKIIQEVIGVDPQNAYFCDDDPDMRMGAKSITRFTVSEEKLYLYLPLGEEEIIYVWDRQNK